MRLARALAAVLVLVAASIGVGAGTAHAATFLGFSYTPNEIYYPWTNATYCTPSAVISGGSNLTCSYGNGRHAYRHATLKDNVADGYCAHVRQIGSAYTYYGTVKFTTLAQTVLWWTPCAW